MKFEKHVLPNGLTIIAECNPHALSTAAAFFVRTGSRDETPEVAGVSHFLEHMAFKGSEKRSAEDVNRQFDEVGAKYNAYTTEEHTVFHAAVLPEYLPAAIDLLADLLRPTLRSDDFEMERKVILEEIGMYADSPMWSAYERAMRLHFGQHPLGNSVLGSTRTVGGLSASRMRGYHASRYHATNVFVAATGKIDWPRLVELVESQCGGWSGEPVRRTVAVPSTTGSGVVLPRGSFLQECLFLMNAGPPADSPLRFSADLLASIIGDETGSRFHWALAEPGKVESIDFSYHEYEGAGAFVTCLNCDPELAEEDLETVRRVLAEVTHHGVTDEEVEQAKNKIGSRIVLAAERPVNRLSSLGYNWSYRGEYRDIADDLRDLNAVSVDTINELLSHYPLLLATTVALGPLSKLDGLEVRDEVDPVPLADEF